MKNIQILLVLAVSIVLWSCEDVIEIDLDDAPTQIVVDAWLDNKVDKTQSIVLTTTEPYFNNQFNTRINRANVTIYTSSGDTLFFEETDSGIYTWQPEPGKNIGAIGTVYTLEVEANGSTYSAVSVLNPVPAVDSITQEFRTDEIIGPDGIYAEMFARDLPGLGNSYWIKTFKNGEFLNKPQELNIAFDGAFDPGAQLDAAIFIEPIRELVNRVPDEDNEADNIDVAPWEVGDSILVEIHSINNDAFFFLDVARDQMTNGDNTIFALPLSNADGNIVNVSGGEEPLGVFNVAAVSSLGDIIREQ